MLLRSYYWLKPLFSRRLLLILRRMLVQRKLKKVRNVWPIDETAGIPPAGWRGWPDGKKFALVLTHDVERSRGRDRCRELAGLEERLGFRSSFNFVGEDYHTPPELRNELVSRGHEVGLHGLSHDGHMYRSRKIFLAQAVRINRLLKEWQVVGFRSPAMHHNLEWLSDLDIVYDASTFDTDPFEPYPDGARTIFPFFVKAVAGRPGYVELPYTLPQDFTLYVILRRNDIETWRQKLEWIAERGGMALLITHPDYMAFTDGRPRFDEFSAKRYEEFLQHVRARYEGMFWNALPCEVARYCAAECVQEVDLPAARSAPRP